MKHIHLAAALLAYAACVCIAPGAAQQRSGQVEGPGHFRWSKAAAQELPRGKTIQTVAGLTPRQKQLLTDAIVRQIRSHRSLSEFFEGMPESKLRDLAAHTRITLVDLNRDGVREVIAQAAGQGLCGGTGNCIFWIFQLTPTHARLLLDSLQSEAGFEVITIRPWTTNSFSDIVLGAHPSDNERELVWYKFKLGSYRRKACYSMTEATGAPGAIKENQIRPRNCEELFGAAR